MVCLVCCFAGDCYFEFCLLFCDMLLAFVFVYLILIYWLRCLLPGLCLVLLVVCICLLLGGCRYYLISIEGFYLCGCFGD